MSCLKEVCSQPRRLHQQSKVQQCHQSLVPHKVRNMTLHHYTKHKTTGCLLISYISQTHGIIVMDASI